MIRKTKAARLFSIFAMLMVLAAAFMLGGCGDIALFFGAGVPEGVSIEGVPVEGVKVDKSGEALPQIAQAIKDRTRFVFLYHGQETILAQEYFDVVLNPGKIFEQAIRADKKNVNYTMEYTLDVSKAREAVTKLAARYNTQPVDATATVKPDNPIDQKFEYTQSRDGVRILEDEIFARLQQQAASKDLTRIDVSFETLKAAVTADDLKKAMSLIGSFRTSFKGSKLGYANRVSNIAKAAGLINGKVLPPGEEFSANEILGPRTTANGWKSAGAIWDGMMVHEPGGGVCQVSTTTWNAALFADLEITERTNHTIPSAYVPLGRDATISTGAQDLRFKNNKAAPVYLFATANADEKWIQVDIYGPPHPAGLEIKINSHQTSSWEPTGLDEYVVDPTLAVGDQVVDRDRRSGRSATTNVEYWQNGVLANTVKIRSVYKATTALIRCNPAPAATP